MTNKKSEVLTFLQGVVEPMAAAELAAALQMDRANVSRYLNSLFKENQVFKYEGRPVRYEATQKATILAENSDSKEKDVKQTAKIKKGRNKSTSVVNESSKKMDFDHLIGATDSLKMMIQQAKAAIMYPPRGLHTIIFGKTGTGKSLFAECMYQFAVDSEALDQSAPFIAFNCADYAQNPQLLFGHIFGVTKGAFTGATENREGLVGQADGGILFLDEIHRLPPEGQEMLFTFIDKGTYRPLGYSGDDLHASVQIIGATTESSETFLTTFNRRIPMAITLPALSERSIDERYEIVSHFIKQEANRLQQKIVVERDVILAFMLYHAEGNVGQIKRDIKLVCARAFLHFRTHPNEYQLNLNEKDLPVTVQKGLLRIKEFPDRLERIVDRKMQHFYYEPGEEALVWQPEIDNEMELYQAINEKVDALSTDELQNKDLENLIASDVEAYFHDYIEKLAKKDVHKELIPKDVWQLTEKLYQVAEERLDRRYNEKARFAFALHLQSALERIKEQRQIIHPDLNNVRKNYSKEFQVAIDLSAMIEQTLNIDMPFDEIGFITMFLTIDVSETLTTKSDTVAVIVLMHGTSTATSMLETVQELLGTDVGFAMNMPLTMKVQQMYSQLKEYVLQQKAQMQNGLLLLTDMGSLNSFANLVQKELGVRTKNITMTSTAVVLEAVRMASIGRSLEDIYQACQMSFESMIREQFHTQRVRKKAVIVTCFTGEGVAAKLYERIAPVVNIDDVKIITLQFLQKEAFKQHIDELMEEYEIKAIAGTVEFDYQNIPFFSALDIFSDEKLNLLKRMVHEEVPLDQMIQSLDGTLTAVASTKNLLTDLQQVVQQMQNDLHLIVKPGIDAGIMLHIAFLIDSLLQGQTGRTFNNIQKYEHHYRIEMDIIRTNLMNIEKNYHIEISEDEVAYLTEMFVENQIQLIK